MIVRDANEADLFFILEEGVKFLELYPANLQKDYDLAHLEIVARNVMENHVLLIVEDGTKKLGMIAGLISPNLFNPSYIGLQEIVWWVKEEGRVTSAASRLLKAFELRAEALGVDFITMTTTSYTPTLEKLYKKLNFIPAENTYIKEL